MRKISCYLMENRAIGDLLKDYFSSYETSFGVLVLQHSAGILLFVPITMEKAQDTKEREYSPSANIIYRIIRVIFLLQMKSFFDKAGINQSKNQENIEKEISSFF